MCNVYIAYFLWFVSGCGALGLHRFYMRKNVTGVLWLLTGGLGMAGSIYDALTMPRQVRETNLRLQMRNQLDGLSFASTPLASPQTQPRERLERTILRIAKANKGRISASELALEADIPIEEAKSNLEQLVSKGFAELRVTSGGSLVYVFPDLLRDSDPLETF